MENKEILSSSSSSEKHQFDEYEEEKMEKFYQIIRAFNEARNKHQFSLFKSPLHKHNPKKKLSQDLDDKPLMAGSDNDASTWMPSFKWEDFRAVHHHQVVESDKSDVNFLNPSSNCVDNHNNSDIKKFDTIEKKRKINQVAEEDDDETTPATRTYHQQFANGLDLNLAL